MRQVLLFSLIPLVLVFAGVIGGSMHGVDSNREVFPTAAPTSENSAPPTPRTPDETALQLRAQNLLFDTRSLTARPNAPVLVQFNNADAGVPHNFALYNNNTASQRIFEGELVTGPIVTNYSFTAPAAGTYFFRCDAHPDTMTGSFTVR